MNKIIVSLILVMISNTTMASDLPVWVKPQVKNFTFKKNLNLNHQ